VAEQALFSLGGFVTSLVLGRFGSPKDFAVFSAMFAVFVFLSRFHQSLLLEPLAVYARTRYATREAEYCRLVTSLHWYLAAPFLVAALAVGSPWISSLGASLWSAAPCAVTGPILLRYWLARRLCYTALDTRGALVSTGTYSASLLGLVAALHLGGCLNPATVWAAMAAAALAAVAVAERRLRTRLRRSQTSTALRLSAVLRRHLRFGKWGVIFTVVDAATDAAYLPMVSLVAGATGTALYRASESLFLPAQQFLSALVLFYMPRFAESLARKPMTCVKTHALRAALFTSLFCAFYSAVVVALGGTIVTNVFPSPIYREAIPLLPLMGAWLVARCTGAFAVGTVLRAADLPATISIASFAGAACTCTLGVILTHQLGLRGAVIARAIAAVVLLGALLALTFGRTFSNNRLLRRRAPNRRIQLEGEALETAL
jgi:O-antigen/teichoic acid export membrane protein